MFLEDIIHMAKPVVGEPNPVSPECGENTTATVMANDHDVFNLQYLNGKLHDGKAVEIGMDHDIGHISVNEEFSRGQPHDLVGRNPAVCTANP
jgi:hypothetical protein